jgi:hypothetical protein
MKTLLYITTFVFSLGIFAQGNENLRERIKAQKVAFITEKLDLSPKEAEQFWPIYNDYEDRVEVLRNGEMRNIKSKIRQNPDMSDKEADALLEDLIKAEDKMYRAKVDLMTNLKGVISSKKIIRLKRAEDEFNQKLLERLKEMRNKRFNRN